MDSLRKELQAVSTKLYLEHNSNFLIVDAILDGLIKMSEHKASYQVSYSNGAVPTHIEEPVGEMLFGYIFKYQDGKITINSKPLDDLANMVYVNKIKNFFSHENSEAPDSFTLTNFTLKSKDIFEPYSYFRKGQDRGVVYMLIEDKLLDTTYDYTVIYNLEGLFINYTKVSEMSAMKYTLYINKNGFTPNSPKDQLYIDKKQIKCDRGHKF